MAPNPLIDVQPDGYVTWGDSDELRRNVQLGSSFASAIVAWSGAESYFGPILVQFLGVSSKSLLAVLKTLRSSSAQDQAIDAVAAEKLSGDELRLFRAVIDVVRKKRKKRNQLAHSVVFQTPDLADHWILVDPVDFNSAWYDFFAGKGHLPAQTYKEFAKKAIVFSNNDFDDIAREFDRLTDCLIWLLALATPNHKDRQEAIAKLRTDPDVSAALRKQKKPARP